MIKSRDSPLGLTKLIFFFKMIKFPKLTKLRGVRNDIELTNANTRILSTFEILAIEKL